MEEVNALLKEMEAKLEEFKALYLQSVGAVHALKAVKEKLEQPKPKVEPDAAT